ncbi:copper chaperone PCu(A)C [Frankia sp. R82]|uniref:copper chaperone PCu(A)C n=1 Tax=Frankia sp. R82 TaxID=2950553 RepID=UPI002043754A|nr:copper chaperone PCu(A)C [Frankia sp. R82]MCM3882050.1 copper chaperone PCu(A)C [Frankia sp. R82]
MTRRFPLTRRFPEPASRWPSGHPSRRRSGRLLAATAAAAATLLTTVACGPAGSASSASSAAGSSTSAGAVPTAAPGTASADLGDLHIRGAYIPQQSSDTEAAAYLTVTNTGGTPDALTSIATPAAPKVGLHTTVSRGGSASMQQITELAVPAHGTAALAVGHNHAMLENPVHRLVKGEHVQLTLTFAHAGTVTLTVPVVGYTGPNSHDVPDTDMSGMDMSGMDMSGTSTSGRR